MGRKARTTAAKPKAAAAGSADEVAEDASGAVSAHGVVAGLPVPRGSPTVPNLGQFENLDSLSAEFRFNKSFGKKVVELGRQGFKGWRRVRGDGNCFYRAFGLGLLEQILRAPPRWQRQWAQSLLTKLEQLDADFAQGSGEQKGHRKLVAHLASLAAGTGWQDTSASSPRGMTQQDLPHQQALLEASFEDTSEASLDAALTRALRALIAKHVVANADDDTSCNGLSFRMVIGAQGGGSPEEFCQNVILKMGVEAETIVFTATAQALGVGLQIALLDREDASGVFLETYDVVVNDGDECPVVHVQHRPGHYDLLYLYLPGIAAVSEAHEAPEVSSEEARPALATGQGDYSCGDPGYNLTASFCDDAFQVGDTSGQSFCAACAEEPTRPSRWQSWFRFLLSWSFFSSKLPAQLCKHATQALEALRGECNILKSQVADLEQELAQARALAVSEQNGAKSREAALGAKIQGLEAQLTKIRRSAEQDADSLSFAAAGLQEQLKASEADAQKASDEAARLRQELETLKGGSAQQAAKEAAAAAADHLARPEPEAEPKAKAKAKAKAETKAKPEPKAKAKAKAKAEAKAKPEPKTKAKAKAKA